MTGLLTDGIIDDDDNGFDDNDDDDDNIGAGEDERVQQLFTNPPKATIRRLLQR